MLTHHTAHLSKSSIHYVTAGEGYPVLLLHGWPQTWRCWRQVIELLAEGYRVIAPDLPGLGDSINRHGNFDKKSLAADLVELCEHLAIDSYHLVGHDWGGGVAWAMAAHFPGGAHTLSLVDIAIPGDGNPNISQNGARWHHAFHQTAELPEQLITGREDTYFGWFYRNYGHRDDVISAEEQAEYVRAYSQPSALKNGLALYRAFQQDCQDNTARAATYRPDIPILAVGGGMSWGRGAQVAESARRMAAQVTGAIVQQAGHWIPEEQPAELVGLLVDFWQTQSRG